jgi:hypothetical protein
MAERPRTFGKFGGGAPAAVATVAVGSTRMGGAVARIRAALASHGPLALKVFVVLWVVAMLASAFFVMKA